MLPNEFLILSWVSELFAKLIKVRVDISAGPAKKRLGSARSNVFCGEKRGNRRQKISYKGFHKIPAMQQSWHRIKERQAG